MSKLLVTGDIKLKVKNQNCQLWDDYDLKFFFKLKNSKVFYERVIFVSGIKALNQTLFVNYPV
jgi:hypothetical protein